MSAIFTDMKKAHVLGLGPTLKTYLDNQPKGTTWGVNDIFRKQAVNNLVIVDKPPRFPADRMMWIKLARPEMLWTCFEDWSWHKCYRKFNLARHSAYLGSLDDPEKVCFSICSPYVAVVLAHLDGAEEITLHGVDIAGHWELGEEAKMNRVLRDFKALRVALNERDKVIQVSSKLSALSKVLPVAG